MHDSKRIIKNAQLVLHTNRAMKPDNKCRNPVHLHCSRKPVERQIMSNEEIVEMVTILMEMSTDTYLKCKHMILADARTRSSAGTINFLDKLFELTDKNRPLMLEMK